MTAAAFHLPNFEGQFRGLQPNGTALKATNVGKQFGGKTILHHLNLEVEAGQFVAIVGRSGCGKSTLLRLICGLDQPTSGTILFDGKPFVPGDSSVRVMFQEPRLLPWASVLANVEVGGGRDAKTPAVKERALETLRAVGLEGRSEDWPSSLSGGQKQRVALARALLSKPKLLALDEPLGALDALTRIEMQQLLENIWLRDGFTALLVTHDVSEALMLADRVVMIENGVIALDMIIDLPRPRRRGSVELALKEEQILKHLLKTDAATVEYTI